MKKLLAIVVLGLLSSCSLDNSTKTLTNCADHIYSNKERKFLPFNFETLISFNTKYTKTVLAKNTTGAITDYQTNAITTFVVEKENNSEKFVINEKFNFKKMTDKYEEKNYERNVKKNFANSISQKLILRLAVF